MNKEKLSTTVLKALQKSLIIAVVLLAPAKVFSQESVVTNPADIAPLLIGEKIPDSRLRDLDSKEVTLTELVAQKPTVLIFYRGGWCPYCNMHLSELQSVESKIVKAGYQIVAISPDTPQHLKETKDKSKLSYILLSDSQTKAIKAFGLAYKAPQPYSQTIAKASDNNNTDVLPVPAVFILNVQGEILFEYINPDFKKRVPGNLLLTVAEALKQ
ncbi:MAG TPA: peroxiredoxin-like family protein [Ohtaekwangia sp.]|uniref:peroxiredoxin-like family protein n=1 Tax=Ohtaekwangia sp. TaxID=2066019 RepID=UPI002F9563A5